MNRVSIGEIKAYLGLDGEEQNKLLAVFLSSAEHTVEKVLRKKIDSRTPEIVKTAILFIVWQLYFHRDNSEFKASEVESTVAVMLSDIRKKEF
jgi:hypothetical protein